LCQSHSTLKGAFFKRFKLLAEQRFPIRFTQKNREGRN